MELWGTFLATAFGAAVGAFAAWLFALDLRRREREDRAEERRLNRDDRERERQQDLEAREAARLEERLDREAQRRAEAQANVFRRWPLLLEALTSFANTNRAVWDANRRGRPATDHYEAHFAAVGRLTRQLHDMAVITADEDYEMVNGIGNVVISGTSFSRAFIRDLDEVNNLLLAYITSPPEHRHDRRRKVLSGLRPMGQSPSSDRQL